jgi:hypothetical protein
MSFISDFNKMLKGHAITPSMSRKGLRDTHSEGKVTDLIN